MKSTTRMTTIATTTTTKVTDNLLWFALFTLRKILDRAITGISGSNSARRWRYRLFTMKRPYFIVFSESKKIELWEISVTQHTNFELKKSIHSYASTLGAPQRRLVKYSKNLGGNWNSYSKQEIINIWIAHFIISKTSSKSGRFNLDTLFHGFTVPCCSLSVMGLSTIQYLHPKR
jgi:hypothetical protein